MCDLGNIGNALVIGTQPRDRLGKGGSEDDKMSTHLCVMTS